MERKTQIPALERAKAIASAILNPSVDAFKAAGGRVVGCFGPDTPVEILEGAGLMPFDLRGTGATGTEYADAYFRQLTCEFTRTTFNQLADGQYDFLDGAVVYNCCDHLRRIADNWKTIAGNPFYHFIYIPKKRSDDAYKLYQSEIRDFVRATEERFGVTITPEALGAAIAESNKTRALIRELYELRKGEEVLIDGAETAAVLSALGSIPRAEFNALLRELIDALKACGETVKPRRRLMLAAGHCDKPEFLEALESQGGLVVYDTLSKGIKSAASDIAETDDPLEALMHWYFWEKNPMPRVFGTQDERLDAYFKAVDDYRVDGVISARLTMCDLWAFEQYMLTQALDKKDIPGLELEVNYILDGIGQIRTRVQAFVENCPKRCH